LAHKNVRRGSWNFGLWTDQSFSPTQKPKIKDSNMSSGGKRDREDAKSPSSDDDDDEDSYETDPDSQVATNSNHSPADTGKREKRLAMNRESARARRKRKKVLLESLGSQASEQTKENHTLRIDNEALRSRTQLLESALRHAQATIAALSTLLSDNDVAHRQTNPTATQQLAGLAGLVTPASQQRLLALAQASNPVATQQRNLQALLRSVLPNAHQASNVPTGATDLASISENLQSQNRSNNYAQLMSLVGLGGASLQPNVAIASPTGIAVIDQNIRVSAAASITIKVPHAGNSVAHSLFRCFSYISCSR
jgi:hypothetical protein